MLRTRFRARLFLVVALVLANGYAAVVLYTFALGPRVTAHVTHCSHGGKHTTCQGTWRDPDGTPDDGEINGAGGSDEGTDLTVRLGPFGAYVEDADLWWFRLVFPAAADVGVVLGIRYLTPARRRMRAAARDLLAAPDADLVVIARSEGALHPDGSVYLVVRGGLVHDAAGVPVFVLDGGVVATVEGRMLGLLSGNMATYLLRDADERTVATATTATGGEFDVTEPDGQLVAQLAYQGGDQWVLRVEHPLDEPLRILVLAFALDIHRLSGIRR